MAGYSNKYTKYSNEVFIVMPVRIAYPFLHEPRMDDKSGNLMYSVQLIIPKADSDTLATISEKLCECGEVENIDQLVKHPFVEKDGSLRDGDDPKNSMKLELHGNLYCTAKSKNRPTYGIVREEVVDGELRSVRHRLADEDVKKELYAGCYCAIGLSAMRYDKDSVTLYLMDVTKLVEGERLGISQADLSATFANAFQKKMGKPVLVDMSVPQASIAQQEPVAKSTKLVAMQPMQRLGAPASNPTPASLASKFQAQKAPVVAPVVKEVVEEVAPAVAPAKVSTAKKLSSLL